MNYKIKTPFMELYEELCEFSELEENNTKKKQNPSPADYFKIITSSIEEAAKSITEVWGPYVLAKKQFDLSSTYCTSMAKVTSGNHLEIGSNDRYNYKAFLNKVAAKFGITKQDIINLIKTGNLNITGTPSEPTNNDIVDDSPLARARKIRMDKKLARPTVDQYFNEITSSKEAAVQFIIEKLKPYVLRPNQRGNVSGAYAAVLALETSAKRTDLYNTPVSYKAFLNKIESAYGLTWSNVKELLAITKSQMTQDSEDISDLWLPEKPEISQEMKDVFHKQNIRILQLLARYTDIHRNRRVDLNDLLRQLDDNRLRDPYQAERDFHGI